MTDHLVRNLALIDSISVSFEPTFLHGPKAHSRKPGPEYLYLKVNFKTFGQDCRSGKFKPTPADVAQYLVNSLNSQGKLSKEDFRKGMISPEEFLAHGKLSRLDLFTDVYLTFEERQSLHFLTNTQGIIPGLKYSRTIGDELAESMISNNVKVLNSRDHASKKVYLVPGRIPGVFEDITASPRRIRNRLSRELIVYNKDDKDLFMAWKKGLSPHYKKVNKEDIKKRYMRHLSEDGDYMLRPEDKVGALMRLEYRFHNPEKIRKVLETRLKSPLDILVKTDVSGLLKKQISEIIIKADRWAPQKFSFPKKFKTLEDLRNGRNTQISALHQEVKDLLGGKPVEELTTSQMERFDAIKKRCFNLESTVRQINFHIYLLKGNVSPQAIFGKFLDDLAQ